MRRSGVPLKRQPMRLPPGPRGRPLVGSALDIARDPLGFCCMVAREYGDISYIKLGIWPGYLLNHPDYIKQVLQDHHQNYSKETGTSRVLRYAVGDGLLTTQGETWLRQRRLVQPAFHRHHVASLGKMMTDATGAMIERWTALAESGQPFDVSREMHGLALRIIAAALFSTDLTREAEAIGAAAATANKALATFLVLPFSFLRWPMPWNRHVRAAVSVVDAQVDGMIARRRAAADAGDDLLGMLLSARDADTGEGMTDKQIRDEVKTELLAGHETTVNLLSWAWQLLSEHPEVERRLQAEVDAVLGDRVPDVRDLPQLVYTRMVVDEVLRLYPSVWVISRKAIEADEIGGYVLPAHAALSLSPYVMHRHPAFWDEPERFMPERFAPERVRQRPRFAYFPFGGGPHLCIGNQLALTEAVLVIAMVTQRYRLRVLPDHPVETAAMITLRPRHGVPVVLERRTDRAPERADRNPTVPIVYA